MPEATVGRPDLLQVDLDAMVWLPDIVFSPGGTNVYTQFERRVVPAVPLLVELFELGPGEHRLLLVEGLIVVGGEPVCLGVTYFLEDTPDQRIDERPIRLPDLFRRSYGTALGSCASTIEVAPCEGRTAQLLEIEEGAPVLMRQQLLRDVTGRPREVCHTHYRADRVEFTGLAVHGGFH
jgi:GntR family transcriptional regulator